MSLRIACAEAFVQALFEVAPAAQAIVTYGLYNIGDIIRWREHSNSEVISHQRWISTCRLESRFLAERLSDCSEQTRSVSRRSVSTR
jgi:hypothetical protein